MTRAALLAVLLALLLPAVAHAGTYEVWSCAGPDGKPVPADGWAPEGGGGVLERFERLPVRRRALRRAQRRVRSPGAARTLAWHFHRAGER